MKTLCLVAVMGSVTPQAFGQAAESRSAPPVQPRGGAVLEEPLGTPTGHEVSIEASSYTYKEPGATSISIHGAKVAAEYAGTRSLDERGHWFVTADVRGIFGNTTYDGWCSPYLIRPDSLSPNGYALDLGDPSPCSESGDRDWYVEARGLVGKDLVRGTWGVSPFGGLGFRHLSNGTTGVPGFRTDEYLYVPLGVTARTRVASHSMLSFTLEYDQLIHGWQKTRNSALGGGDVPATATAPAFTIVGISDVSFSQHGGRAVRASVRYQVSRHWSLEPSYVYWNVNASPVSNETATFTVNNVTAREQLGFYEPHNVTHELGVKLGFRF